MDFLKSGIKTVLGTGESTQQPSAAETVEKLVDRVSSSILLDDRRDACRSLRSLSRKYRIEVGAQSMSALVQILHNDRQDCEIITYALETLGNIVSVVEFDEDAENIVTVNVGEQFTEMLMKKPEHINLIMDCLEEYDFRVRRAAIHLVTKLIQNRTRDMQEHILVSPMGISKLMDLLSDSREVIRNDALLLLIQLTKGNSNIQKIAAFENAFDKLFDIIEIEGCVDGGIVVEDCLILLLNLLKNNSSNQQFFKEGSAVQRLVYMFEFATKEINNESWPPQKMSNVHCMLQVIRALVTPNNQQQVITTFQKIMHHHSILQTLCIILMSSGIPLDVLTETINAVAEIIRGDAENQKQLTNIMAPSKPSYPVLIVLLMSMVNEKQLLTLRCSILYAFKCYLFRNPAGQKDVVQTLLPSSDSDVPPLSIGQLLCAGLFANDTLSNWLSAVGLMHALVDNTNEKEKLLCALLSTAASQKPISLFEQCTCLLQEENYKIHSKVGILMLLCMWIAYCPLAVKALINSPGTMTYLTAQVSNNEVDEMESLLQSLCAFMIGLCVQFNDNSLPNHRRDDICQLIVKRIGQEEFCNKLSNLSRNEAYSRACKQPCIRANSPEELLLDYEFCNLFKNLEPLVIKVTTTLDINSLEFAELTMNSETSALVAQYKGIIREFDSQIKALQSTVNHLEKHNIELERNLIESNALNSQLNDQNILLKAQLAVLKNEKRDSSNITNSEVKCFDYAKSLHLHETNHKFQNETISTNEVNEKLQVLQKEQEDLLALLIEQDNKIINYKKVMRAAGLLVQDDDDDNESNESDSDKKKQPILSCITSTE